MIQITEKLRIRRADDKNLVIEELRTISSEKKGDHDEWCWCGFYGTFKSALLGVLHKRLFESVKEELQLKDCIAKINEIEKEIGRIDGNKRSAC